MAVVDELIAILGYEMRGEDALRRFQNGLARAQRGLTTMAAAAARWGTRAAGAAAAGAGLLGRSILKTSGEFERYSLILETIEGSQDKARQSMGWITKFASTTPYELAGVTDAFVKLKAYGIDPIADDTLRILGDTSSAMGKPLQQAVEALADAQTGEFERMNEFGLKASQAGDEVTFRWSENNKELTRTVRKNSEEIRRFILENFGDRFAGAMDKQSKGWESMLSNLSDTWTNFLVAIGAAGMFDYAKVQLKGLLDWIAARQADGSWDRWANNISSAFIAVSEATVRFVGRLRGHFETMSAIYRANEDAISSWWGIIKWVLLGIGLYLFPVLGVIALLALAFDDFLTYLAGGESVIGNLLDGMKAKWRDVAEWGRSLPGNVAEWWADKGGLIGIGSGVITALWRGMKAAWGSVIGWGGSLLDAVVAWFERQGDLASAGQSVIDAIWRGMKAGFDMLAQNFGAEIDALVFLLTGKDVDTYQAGVDFMSSFWAGMQSIGGQISEWFWSLIPDPIAGLMKSAGAAAQSVTPNGMLENARAGLDVITGKVEMPEGGFWSNVKANLGLMDQGAATQEVVNDSRDQSSHVQVSVTQNVALTEAPAAAAGAVASATGAQVAAAATPARSGGGGGR